MPKVLCIIGFVAAGLLLLIFGGDLALSLLDAKGVAPLHNGGMILDVTDRRPAGRPLGAIPRSRVTRRETEP